MKARKKYKNLQIVLNQNYYIKFYLNCLIFFRNCFRLKYYYNFITYINMYKIFKIFLKKNLEYNYFFNLIESINCSRVSYVSLEKTTKISKFTENYEYRNTIEFIRKYNIFIDLIYTNDIKMYKNFECIEIFNKIIYSLFFFRIYYIYLINIILIYKFF